MTEVEQIAESAVALQGLDLRSFIGGHTEILKSDLVELLVLQNVFNVGHNVISDVLRHVEGKDRKKSVFFLPFCDRVNVTLEDRHILFAVCQRQLAVCRQGKLLFTDESGKSLTQFIIHTYFSHRSAVHTDAAEAVFCKEANVFQIISVRIMPDCKSVYHKNLHSAARAAQITRNAGFSGPISITHFPPSVNSVCNFMHESCI